jgi:hypothetical protein
VNFENEMFRIPACQGLSGRYGTPGFAASRCSTNILCLWHYFALIGRNVQLSFAPEEQNIYRKKKLMMTVVRPARHRRGEIVEQGFGLFSDGTTQVFNKVVAYKREKNGHSS